MDFRKREDRWLSIVGRSEHSVLSLCSVCAEGEWIKRLNAQKPHCAQSLFIPLNDSIRSITNSHHPASPSSNRQSSSKRFFSQFHFHIGMQSNDQLLVIYRSSVDWDESFEMLSFESMGHSERISRLRHF